MIYRNILGGFEYKLSIRYAMKGENWSKGTASGEPLRGSSGSAEWRISTMIKGLPRIYGNDRAALTRALEATGFEESERGHFEHIATREASEAAMREHEKRRARGRKGYVRFGELPADGISRNYRDGYSEAGVSVFRARILGSAAWLELGTNHELGSLLLGLADRPAYIVIGDEIGPGSDGEPVLTNARLGRKLREIYH